ncbi:MAG TPA: gamma-glutamylcyclotransferase family protein [Myxococcota bacterium]|nr:gamma-glutamylcyclotransferase family protein [Myxococcota bacterium]
MTRQLFTYGTLMFPAVVRRLARRALPMRPAQLRGFARRALRGVGYPGIVPDCDAVVTGVLVGGVSPALLARLDRWEGVEYERRLVSVETLDGAPALAHVYALAPRTLPRVLAIDWDAAAFEREQLARWLRMATHFCAREIDR